LKEINLAKHPKKFEVIKGPKELPLGFPNETFSFKKFHMIKKD
jgi:hypothetical protein